MFNKLMQNLFFIYIAQFEINATYLKKNIKAIWKWTVTLVP